MLGTIVRDAIQAVSAVRKSGWDVDMLAQVASYDEAVAEVPGGVTEGLYAMTSVQFINPEDPRPAVQDFVTKYKKEFGKEPNFAAQIGYTDGQLLIQGLQNAGRDLTLDSFIAGMEKIKDYKDIFGSPPMSYGPNKRQGSNESFLTRVHNGHWVTVVPTPLGY
jgi:branched-chain amino acid transport system substrate-binding protein